MAPLTPFARRVAIASLIVASFVGIATIPNGVSLDVVDVIPPLWNTDVVHHPEPSIAVNPVHPDTIAVSAYMLGDTTGSASGFCGPQFGGLLMSYDGGWSWQMRCMLPKLATVGDASIDFTGDGSALLASYFGRGLAWRVESFRHFHVSGLLMETHANMISAIGTLAAPIDQPIVVAAPGPTSSAFTVGLSYVSGGCPVGGVIAWWNMQGTNGVRCVSTREGVHVITVRTAHASDGRVYGLFFNIREPDAQNSPNSGEDEGQLVSDLVLVRGRMPSLPQVDDKFDELHDTVLLDSHVSAGTPCAIPDGGLGQRLRNCAHVPLDAWDENRNTGAGPGLGSQVRNPDQLAIAVDPNDPHTVYYAYGDSTPGDLLSLHLARWSDVTGRQSNTELRLVRDAINPALVVTTTGRIGFAYQRLSGGHWQTRIQVSSRDRSTWKDVPLTGLSLDGEPKPDIGTAPYLGDYMDIAAVGDTIFGTFSFNNNPAANPNARYLRDKSSLGAGQVPYAIDPFFYKVTFDRPLYAIIGRSLKQDWFKMLDRLRAWMQTRPAIPTPPDSGPPPPALAPRAR